MKFRIAPTVLTFAATLAVAVVTPAGALGQAPGRPAAQSAYVNNQLNKFRQSSIGNDYTISQINNINLRRAGNQVFNVNGSSITQAAAPVNNLGSAGDVAAPTRMAATFDSFGSAGTSSKPFSNTTRDPTLSPYLNLFREDLNDNNDNYNTLVRPMVQQQQVNRSLQVEAQAINRRVQSISAKPAFNPQGSTSQSPTGHPTGFMYYSHFYPSAGRR